MNASKLVTLVVLVALLGAALWLMKPADQPMPPVTFTLTDGSQIRSDELRGQRVLVNFWSVSCEVCKRDMPRLKVLHESLADQRFTVIGVAMSYDPPPAIFDAVAKLQPGYPIALDTRGEIGKAFGDVRVTPTTFLIDPQGNIRYSASGPLDESRIRATLTTF